MNMQQPLRISVIDPIGLAIERVKVILFRPFDLNKWFVIGFCAWLAGLGSGGGGGGGGGGHGGGGLSDPRQAFGQAKWYVQDNLHWIAPVAVVAVVVIIGIGLLIAWLNSRGKFMFLHCVAENKSQVKVPWHKFRRHGNSLFLFRVVLGVIGFIIVGLPALGIVLLVIMMVTGTGPSVAAVGGIVMLVLAIIALAIALSVVKKFTLDFVVPIMFLRTASCVAGWREFMAILSANMLPFALYLLFQIVIAIAIGVIIFAVVLMTCCCAGCFLAIPYIGTVLMLPVLVFKRGYSLYYLRQFGPQFDVFGPDVEAVGPV